MACAYCKTASAAAVVYDIMDAASFAKAKHWVSELQKYADGILGKLQDPTASA